MNGKKIAKIRIHHCFYGKSLGQKVLASGGGSKNIPKKKPVNVAVCAVDPPPSLHDNHSALLIVSYLVNNKVCFIVIYK